MKKQKSGVMTVVAAGRVAAPDANRITLKRLVLTALPYKIKKRKATGRHACIYVAATHCNTHCNTLQHTATHMLAVQDQTEEGNW